MKNIYAYIFFSVMLVNNLPVTEICKVSKLFEHYSQHEERDSRTTVQNFLSMHYFGKDINDNDQQEDMQLPFKKYDAEIFKPYLFCNSDRPGCASTCLF